MSIPHPAPCIAITGATGFVGKPLCQALIEAGYRIKPMSRELLGDLAREQSRREHLMPALFEGVDQVVHLAAIAHRGGVDDSAYDAVNHHAALVLAHAAAEAGCKRFIFLSTAKVLGDTSPPGKGFTDSDPPAPPDAYARAKLAAEQALAELAGTTAMETISLRPPLVHGPEASANFGRLLQLCRDGGIAGLPVPLGRTGNQRSLIGLGTLIDAILAVIRSEQPVSGQYLLAEQPALATSDIIKAIADGIGKPAPVFSVPPDLLRLALTIMGKAKLADRLLGDFAVDDAGFRRDFNWQSHLTSRESIAETALTYRAQAAK